MKASLRELGREVRHAQDEVLRARPTPALERRLGRIHAGLARRSPSPLRGFGVGAGLGLAAAAMALLFLRDPEPLSVMARGGPVPTGEWLSSEAEQLPLAFSDGTTLTLQPNSRARLVRVDERGALFALERGKVTAQVVPIAGASWIVSAGPFEIRVTGTRFDATWEAESEVLRVEMAEGSVRVSGTCLSEPRALSAGESREFSCNRGALASSPSSAEAPAAPPEHAQGATSNPSGTTSRVPKEPAVANEEPATWRELARDGKFKAALSAAEAQDFSGLCNTLAAAEVLELANVARLAGNPVRAAEAYQATRNRFGGSGAAASAAFQLGRVAFDGSRDYAAARRWFGTYLAEQPGGSLAQEALGRVMEAEHRAGDRAAAQQTASGYLARFPGGAHAALAESLLAE